MVCIRFSASSKTTECADSKTSSVTSSEVSPCRCVDLPADLGAEVVEGRQAVQELHVRRCRWRAARPSSRRTGPSAAMRSSQTSLGSPMDTQTSVATKSAPRDALGDVLGERDPARR